MAHGEAMASLELQGHGVLLLGAASRPLLVSVNTLIHHANAVPSTVNGLIYLVSWFR